VSNPYGLNPHGPTLQGIDVAIYQGALDWRAVAQHGVRFAWCKATQGSQSIDPTFARNWAQSKRYGVLRGAYHFLSPGSDPIAQAEHFLRTVGELEPDDLHPMLDVEVDHGKSPEQILDFALRWTERVEAETGRDVVQYTYPSFWIGKLRAPVGHPLGRRPLFIAHYAVDPATGRVYDLKFPTVPATWDHWTVWQVTGNRGPRIPGVDCDVDRNVFWGDEATFRDVMTTSRRTTLPSPPLLADLSLSSPATPLRAGEGEHHVAPEEPDL
jgi:lysozyme